MLQFKSDESIRTAIRHFAHSIKSTVDGVCEDVLLNPDVVSIDRVSIEEMQELIETWVSDFKSEAFSIADRALDGDTDLEFLIFVLNSEYGSRVKDLVSDLYSKMSSNDDFIQNLAIFGNILISINVSEFIQQSRAGQSERLERLLEVKRLSAWRAAFKKDEWSEAQLIHEIRNGISDVIADTIDRVYEEGVDASTLENRVHDLVMQVIREDFFEDYLAESMRDEVYARVEPSESSRELIGTVDEVVEYAEKRLNKRVESVTAEMIDEMRL